MAPVVADVASRPVVVAPEPVASSFAVSPDGLSFDGLTALLLAVVADRTGYPAEMLSMGMELESDLGIDSIKRVEILSAVQDEVVGLPSLDTTVMAELVTLGQIVEYLAGELGTTAVAPTPVPVPVLRAVVRSRVVCRSMG